MKKHSTKRRVEENAIRVEDETMDRQSQKQ
jgi:hypothetical protein